MSCLAAARNSAGSRCSHVGMPCMWDDFSFRYWDEENIMQVWRRRAIEVPNARPAGPDPRTRTSMGVSREVGGVWGDILR